MNNRFEGWYFKQQNASQTVALIPALHQEPNGQRAASLQIITDDESYIVPFAQYQLDRRQYCLTTAGSIVSRWATAYSHPTAADCTFRQTG